ncbi:MAG: cupin domain-containing protein [Telluria sp.]|nr:cupin domain-containing protein [Telluria sp.]
MNQFRPVRRIVTGHNAAGASVILSDEPCPHTMHLPGVPAFGVTDLWKTSAAPASNAGSTDPCSDKIVLAPPENGTVFRVVEFPPDRDYLGKWDAHAGFSGMGESGAQALDARPAPHEAMHTTRSIDYAFVLSGEIVAVLDEDEVVMRAGDVLIQRGTNHAWSNRSDVPATVGFVLIDALPLA